MARESRLCVVVSGNGLGHFKRAMHVVDAVLSQGNGWKVDVHAEAWQRRALFGGRLPVAGKSAPRFHHELMAEAPDWGSGRLTAEGYFSWIEGLARDETLRSGDLVVSDNLVGILAARPDAVLMGSFLWHDVSSRALAAPAPVLSYEEDLLTRTRPHMLCADDVVMPAVERLTRAVRFPWFCAPATGRPVGRWPVRRVLLMGGATEAVDRALRGLARTLHDEMDLELCLSPRLLRDAELPPGRVHRFGFTDADYAACDLVIGRPGVGTLTDCVRFGLPILCFGDEPNEEMRHNASRVEALGMGRAISIDDPEATARLLQEELTREQYENWAASAAARPCGGAEAAARWLSERLDG
jgi:hypothetical protein